MRLSLLILASTYFSVRDILSHLIRNLDLLIFAVIALSTSLIFSLDVYPVSFVVVTLSFFFIAAISGLGMGDVKLVSVLSFFYVPLAASSYADLLLGLCIGSAATLTIGLVRRKSFDFAMPFAPAICFGVIYCASLT